MVALGYQYDKMIVELLVSEISKQLFFENVFFKDPRTDIL